MNYVDGDYVIDALASIHSKGYDIEVDWLTLKFEPNELATARINKSIGYWGSSLEKHLASQNVELAKLNSLKLVWPSSRRKFMLAIDDRGKEYKIYVNEIK
ncbi:hypothetical protein [Vibrio sp. SCSIO 43145]|nr:hypothetical protein [Vibrio sp. SCSIO 43145]USD46851.1 hypothetical protein J4N38_06935 [Vibrio sp. SCSIO 43145]